jgi:hypothetical protein
MTTTKSTKLTLSRDEKKTLKQYREQEKIFSADDALYHQGLRRIFANAAKIIEKQNSRHGKYDSRLHHAGRILSLLQEKQIFEDILIGPGLPDIESLNAAADIKLKTIPSPSERRSIIASAIKLLDGQIQFFGLSEILDERNLLGDLRAPVRDPATGRFPGTHSPTEPASFRSIEKVLKWNDDRFFHYNKEHWYIVDEDAAHQVAVSVPGVGEVTAYFDSVEYARLLTGGMQLDNTKYLAEIYRRKEDAARISPYPQSPHVKYGLTGFPNL